MSAERDDRLPVGPWRLVLGVMVGVAVWVGWWRWNAVEMAATPAMSVGPLVLGAALLLSMVALQALRTAALFPELGIRGVTGPVLAGHGVNTLLGTAGDVVELVWLTRRSDAPLAQTLGRLVYRAIGTAGGAALALGVGLGGAWTLLGSSAMVFVAIVGFTGTPTRVGRIPLPYAPPMGVRATLTHLTALVAQVLTGVAAVVATMAGVGALPGWQASFTAFGAADLSAYLPVPLANLGVHQTAVSWAVSADGAAWGAAVHHGLTLAVGLAVLVLTPAGRQAVRQSPRRASAGSPAGT